MGIAERKYTTITIPKPMYEKLSRIIEHTGFSSVSDYVTYVIRETIAEIEESKEKGKSSTKEKSEVLKKLHALGYI